MIRGGRDPSLSGKPRDWSVELRHRDGQGMLCTFNCFRPNPSIPKPNGALHIPLKCIPYASSVPRATARRRPAAVSASAPPHREHHPLTPCSCSQISTLVCLAATG